jgi:hypothetical protein
MSVQASPFESYLHKLGCDFLAPIEDTYPPNITWIANGKKRFVAIPYTPTEEPKLKSVKKDMTICLFSQETQKWIVCKIVCPFFYKSVNDMFQHRHWFETFPSANKYVDAKYALGLINRAPLPIFAASIKPLYRGKGLGVTQLFKTFFPETIYERGDMLISIEDSHELPNIQLIIKRKKTLICVVETQMIIFPRMTLLIHNAGSKNWVRCKAVQVEKYKTPAEIFKKIDWKKIYPKARTSRDAERMFGQVRNVKPFYSYFIVSINPFEAGNDKFSYQISGA